MRSVAAFLAALALVVAAPAAASEAHPTQDEMEALLVCPSCHVPLDESNSPVAQQMKAFIAERIAQGATRSQIIDELVGPPNNFGPAVLGEPRTHGFDLIAWVLPFAGIAFGAVGIGAAAWFWSRKRPPSERAPALDAATERRIDDELARFDG
ncbi:MAG TPA: cytochrome c-type biogenesis protein CcmH [Gaiellaceae bacterium]|nr:cytochrome c-type biogenesis protein CcmH [Gaiellaceae bacterium]